MDGAIITLKLPLLAMVLLVLYPMTKGQWAPLNPPPLCASQFALVNHACSKLPYMPVPPPSPPSPPLPPPNPPSPDGSGSRRHSSHGHRHRGHRHRETPIEEECCRWVKEVDSVCVCELLVHLPPFLIKPVHNYTVIVDETCSVTFQCSSSLLPV